jgi:hypothetical protein
MGINCISQVLERVRMPGEHNLFTERCEIGRNRWTSDSSDLLRLEMCLYRWTLWWVGNGISSMPWYRLR